MSILTDFHELTDIFRWLTGEWKDWKSTRGLGPMMNSMIVSVSVTETFMFSIICVVK